jgi:hypothetical protein
LGGVVVDFGCGAINDKDRKKQVPIAYRLAASVIPRPKIRESLSASGMKVLRRLRQIQVTKTG